MIVKLRSLPLELKRKVWSYMSIFEKKGISSRFGVKLMYHLKYPRNNRGLATQPISYFSKRRVINNQSLLRSCAFVRQKKCTYRFETELFLFDTYCTTLLQVDVYPHFSVLGNPMRTETMIKTFQRIGTVTHSSSTCARISWVEYTPLGYYTNDVITDPKGSAQMLKAVTRLIHEIEEE